MQIGCFKCGSFEELLKNDLFSKQFVLILPLGEGKLFEIGYQISYSLWFNLHQ